MNLTMPADLLTATGLILDAIGIIILFWSAPEKYPDPQSTAFFEIEDDSRERWRKNQRRRTFVSRGSVIMIVTGFGLQLVAVVFF